MNRTLIIIAIIIFFFPLFKQYRTKYFNAFLMIFLTDIFNLIGWLFFKISPQVFYLSFTSFVVFFLMEKKYKYYFLSASLMINTYFMVFHYHTSIGWYPMVLNLLIIILLLMKDLFDLMAIYKLNLFLMLFVLYFAIIFFNMMSVLLAVDSYRTLRFYIANIFTWLLGIAFSFININTKNFILPGKAIKTSNEDE